MAKIKRVTLHPVKEDGKIDTSINLYPKTLVDGVVDREGNEVDIATQQELDTAKNTLDDKITYESSRAQLKEQELGSAVDGLEDSVDDLTNDLSSEISRAQIVEASLNTKIDNKETELKGLIDDEEDRAQAAELTLSNTISNFSGALVAETTRAASAEGSLQTAINNEVTRAQGAESQLSTHIQEVADSIEEVIQPTVERLEGAIQDETTRATQAEEALDNSKQDNLTAGSGINITNNIISCTLNGVSYSIVNSCGDLPQEGVVGTFYLIPNGESGEINTYDEYIWVNNKYEFIGTTSIDLSDYFTKQEIASLLADIVAKNGCTKITPPASTTLSDELVEIFRTDIVVVNGNFLSLKKPVFFPWNWRELYGTSGKWGLVFGHGGDPYCPVVIYLYRFSGNTIILSTQIMNYSMDAGGSVWFKIDSVHTNRLNLANKYFPSYPTLSTSDIEKVLTYKNDNTMSWENSSGCIEIPAPASTTLTDAEYAIFTSGKIVKVKGSFLGATNPIFFSVGSWTRGLVVSPQNNYGDQNIGIWQINANKQISVYVTNINFSGGKINIDGLLRVNNKALPTYPNDTTKPYKFIQQVGGTLAYSQTCIEWYGTQAEYDALGTYDDNTIYNILED